MKKRLIAFLLVLIMVLGMLPTTALASFDAQEATPVDETEATTYARGPGYQPESWTGTREFKIYVYRGDKLPTIEDRYFTESATITVNFTDQWAAAFFTLSNDPGTYVPSIRGEKVKQYLISGTRSSNAFAPYQPNDTVSLNSAQPRMIIWLEGGQSDVETQTFQYQVVYLTADGKFSYSDRETPVPVEYVCQNSTTNHKRNPNNGGHHILNDDIKTAAGSANYREGYTLIGWCLNPQGSRYSHNDFTSTGTYNSFANNQTIYFLAEKNPETYTFVLKYDANGGTGGPGQDSWSTTDKWTGSHTFDIKADEPTRDGYVFKGWKAQDGSGTIYHSDSTKGVTTCAVSQYGGNDVVRNGNTWTRTLYAVWEPVGTEPEKPDVPGKTEYDILNANVRIECVMPTHHNDSENAGVTALGSYSSAYELGDEVLQGTRNGETRYYVECTITNTAPYIGAFNDAHPGHTEAENYMHVLTTKFWYYPENKGVKGEKVWVADPALTIYVECPPVPTADNLNLKVEVKCVTDNSGHEHELTDKLIEDSFTVSEPDEDGYRIITIKAEKYLAKYADKYPGITHTVDYAEKTAKVFWNKDTRMWVYFKRGTGVDANIITFNVTCESTQEPDAPTDKTLWGLKIANVYCDVDDATTTSGKKHGSTSFEYIRGTLVTNPAITVTDGKCMVYLNVAPYVEAYNSVNTAAVHARKAGATETVPVWLVYNTDHWEVDKDSNGAAKLAQIPVYCDLIPEPVHDAFADDVILIDCDTDQAHNKTLAYKNGNYEIVWTPGSSECTVSFKVSTYVDYYTTNGHANHTAVTTDEYITKRHTYKGGEWVADNDTPQLKIHVACTEQPIYVYFRPVNSNLNPDSNSLTLADKTLNRLGLTYNNDDKNWFTYGKLMSASTEMSEVKKALATTAFTRHADNKDFAYGDLISWAYELEWVTFGYHLGYTETADAYHLNGDLKFYWVKYDTNAGADSDKVTGAPENYYDGGIQDYYLVGEKIDEMPTLSRPGYTFLGWKVKLDRDLSALSLPETDEKTTVDVEGGARFEFTKCGNITFVAQWEENAYTVKFEKNGKDGEDGKDVKGTMADQSFTYDVEKALTKNAYSRDGYTFNGWNTKKDGSGTAYTDEQVVKNLTTEANGVVTLYAQWKVIPHMIYAYTRLESAYAKLTPDEFGEFVALKPATLARLGIGSYNTYNFISFGEFNFDDMPLTEDYYMAHDDDPEVDAAVDAMKKALPAKADAADEIDWTVLYNVEESGMEPGYPTDDEDGYQLSGNLYLATVMFSDGAEGDKVENMPKSNYTVDDVIEIYDFYFTGEKITLPDNVPTRTGYTFKGWKVSVIPADKDDEDEDDGPVCYAVEELVQPGEQYTIKEGGVNFTAEWDANKYTVKFDKNSTDATGTMAEQSFTYDEAAKALSKNAFSRIGYTFAGWKDAAGNTYADEQEVRNLTAEAGGVVTLYAQWNINLYPFVFDSQGGSEVPTQTVAHGSTATEPADPTRSGYWFVGWYTDTTFTKLYDFSTPVTGPTTVYARWSMIIIPGTITKKTPKLNTYDHFAYVQGYPDGTVKPAGNITRAETAAILFRLMDNSSRKTYLSTKSGFRDVTTGSWYNTYVATLNNAGVITDSANGYFRPNEAITRAELAAMLASFAETTRAVNYFDDVSANHWAAKAIAICAELGWITGYPDGSFRPDRNVTRAELMAMINRATGRAPKSADAFLPGMKTWSDNTADKWYYLDVQEATNSHSYAVSPTELWTALTAAPDWSRYE